LKTKGNLNIRILNEIPIIREYLVKKGNKTPIKAIPINEIDTFCLLFELSFESFKKLSWENIVGLIIRKYWNLNILSQFKKSLN
jgi:hypothetical protein